MTIEKLHSIPDDDLLARLSKLLERSRGVEAELVAHIGEVDARRLFARHAAPSMFGYCVDVLHLSEHEAYLRIAAARAARSHPVLLEMLADGRMHLSGIAKLAPHLTEANRDDVLARAAYKSKRQVEELVAELAPRPDVQPRIRKVPQSAAPKVEAPQLGPDRAAPAAPKTAPVPPAPPPKVEPLAPARYKVQFTASAALRDKLERLQALLEADLAEAIEAAVTEKIERLEAKRYAQTSKPRKTVAETDTSPSSRRVPAAIRRAVYERDRGRCTFRDASGRRCPERHRLELHHVAPYGRGGGHSVENLRLVCRVHNAHYAEKDYGRDVMERYRRSGNCAREPAPGYSVRTEPSSGSWRRGGPQTTTSRSGTRDGKGRRTSSARSRTRSEYSASMSASSKRPP